MPISFRDIQIITRLAIMLDNHSVSKKDRHLIFNSLELLEDGQITKEEWAKRLLTQTALSQEDMKKIITDINERFLKPREAKQAIPAKKPPAAQGNPAEKQKLPKQQKEPEEEITVKKTPFQSSSQTRITSSKREADKAENEDDPYREDIKEADLTPPTNIINLKKLRK